MGVFRHVYTSRRNQIDKNTADKDYLLHGLALIGVRSVLGIENLKGSPFNVQRSVHIPNLTYEEVKYLFHCYQRESGQAIESEVIERIWYEFEGQPGLTCWMGELLTETYNKTPDQPIGLEGFVRAYGAASDLLPSNNMLNLISKAKQAPYKTLVLELFRTEEKIKFSHADPIINFLYMNGVVTVEEVGLSEKYVRFAGPFVQKQLFTYFARELYRQPDRLYGPFEDISDTVSDDSLDLRRLLQRYEQYLQANRDLVLKNAPRRKDDLRVYEAVFHFHLSISQWISAQLRGAGASGISHRQRADRPFSSPCRAVIRLGVEKFCGSARLPQSFGPGGQIRPTIGRDGHLAGDVRGGGGRQQPHALRGGLHGCGHRSLRASGICADRGTQVIPGARASARDAPGTTATIPTPPR